MGVTVNQHVKLSLEAMPRPPKGAGEASDTRKCLLVVNEISKGIKSCMCVLRDYPYLQGGCQLAATLRRQEYQSWTAQRVDNRQSMSDSIETIFLKPSHQVWNFTIQSLEKYSRANCCQLPQFRIGLFCLFPSVKWSYAEICGLLYLPFLFNSHPIHSWGSILSFLIRLKMT